METKQTPIFRALPASVLLLNPHERIAVALILLFAWMLLAAAAIRNNAICRNATKTPDIETTQ